MKTTKGDILIELDAEKAPITVENFLSYVDDGFYDGTIFHRVIKNFMIQGGGFDADLKQKKTKDPIKNEATNELSNRRGTIAMARTAVVDSATAQFFINHVDNPGLDHKNETDRGFGYAVFGKVIDGIKVVDAIAKTETGPKGPFRQDCPKETIEIVSVTRVEAKKAEKTE
jgi:cyclophilin family peptidyl-prolyl cis-trans isomerase